MSDADVGGPIRFMKRVSSATGYNERDLNNTVVFPSQDRIPLLLGLLAVGVCGAGAPAGCRRASTEKPKPATSADRRGVAESLPQRHSPALPPPVPSPEQISVPSAARRGGVVRIHLESEPSHLNPLADADAGALQVVTGLVYEPLLECPSPGTGGGYRPVLADSWQVSPDGLRVALHLRSGIRWHDGHGFGVLDVQASLEPLLLSSGSGSPILRAFLQDVAAIEIAADRIVRLVLKRPSDFALRALCDLPILPDHLLRGPTADPGGLAKQPVGTGPYRFSAWERGKRIRLLRSSTYWSAAALVDELVFEVDSDGARALLRTRRGEIDILPRVLQVHYPDEVDPVTLHGTLALGRVRPQRWAYVAINHRKPPLGDPHFRRALSALWDRGRFAHDLHQGLAHPLVGPAFATVPAPPPGAGRDRAIAEMDAGGYRDSNADGVRDSAGTPFRHSLLIATGARAAATEAHAFVFEARKAGLLVDPVPVDAATLLTRVRKGDFDLALMLWEGRDDEDPSLIFGSEGPFNYFGYSAPDVDLLIDSIRQAAGPPARQALMTALGAKLARDQPVLFLYRFDVPALIATRVQGVAAVGARFDLRRIWVVP